MELIHVMEKQKLNQIQTMHVAEFYRDKYQFYEVMLLQNFLDLEIKKKKKNFLDLCHLVNLKSVATLSFTNKASCHDSSQDEDRPSLL